MGWQDDPLAYSVDANTQKFLDFVGKAEGADYNTIVGGGKFNSYAAHPNVVGLRTKEGPSTAAGKYQILNSTYQDVAPKIGVNDFSPESQDRIAVELIKRAGALEDVQKGNYQAAIKKLGGTWASLPSSPYSQPKRSQNWVESALDMVVSPAQAAQSKGGWMDDPVVSEQTPKASPQAAPAANKATTGGWMDDPVVGQEAPKSTPAAPQQAPTPQQPQAKPTLTDAGMNNDPTWIANAKRLYKETQGSDFKGKDAEAADWLKNYVAQTNWNLAGTAGTIYDATSKLSPEGKQALLSSIKSYEDAPTSFESIGRAAKGIFTDPTTYLTGGVGGLITKTIGRKAAAEGVKQAIKSGLEKELVTSATKKAVGAGATYGAVNDLGQQGVQIAADGQDGVDLGQTAKAATIGGATGGALNKLVDKVTGRAAVRDFVKGAGSEEGAKIKAEVTRDLGNIADNPSALDTTIKPIQANALEGRYVSDALNAVNSLDKSTLNKLGVDVKTLRAAAQNRRILTPDELKALRGNPAGDALASSIEKAQYARSLTEQKSASDSILGKATRLGIEATPTAVGGVFGGPFGALVGAMGTKAAGKWAQRLTGKASREEVIQGLIGGGNRAAADLVLDAQKGGLGKSSATKGLNQLQELAKKSQASSAARAEVQQAAKQAATDAGEQLRIRNLQMGIRSNPKFIQGDIGGGTRGTLQYYGRLADSKELAKGLKIIEKTDPYLSPYIASIKQNKGVPNKDILLGLSDRLLKLRDDGILKPYIK